MNLPRFLRRREVRDKLGGISEEAMTKLLKANVLKPHYLPAEPGKKSRAVFLEDEVQALHDKISTTATTPGGSP